MLLTATVAPAASMTHTVRRAPQLRAREYARALRDWAANASVPVVVVENSNANLTALRAAVGPGAAGRFEFVSPPAPAVPDAPSRGKGHAEYAALRWALLHARTLRQGGPCRRVLKVTGRCVPARLCSYCRSSSTTPAHCCACCACCACC